MLIVGYIVLSVLSMVVICFIYSVLRTAWYVVMDEGCDDDEDNERFV